jgi:outer membrane lipoprotein-sorting protein
MSAFNYPSLSSETNRIKNAGSPLLVLLIMMAATHAQANTDADAIKIIRQMFQATKKVKSLSYTMVKRERIKGQILTQKSRVKLALSPLRTYLYQESPKKGLEVLFSEGNYNDKCIINPNGFPWINIYLPPLHPRVLHNQHHNLYKSGYAYVVGILEHLMRKYEPVLHKIITCKPDVLWQGRQAYMIHLDNPSFTLQKHEIKPGETAWDIAKQYMIGEYMVLDRNPDFGFYTDLTPGKSLVIPNDYARRMEIVILKENMLPALLRVYDEKGLFEEYQYLDLMLNPVFSDSDFSKTNPNYGFKKL